MVRQVGVPPEPEVCLAWGSMAWLGRVRAEGNEPRPPEITRDSITPVITEGGVDCDCWAEGSGSGMEGLGTQDGIFDCDRRWGAES